MDDDVDDRYAGIDIDSLLSRNDTRRGLTYGRKKALYEAPEFLKRLYGEETIMEGQALCLECKIQGFPVPTLRWYKDDEEIVDHPRIKVESDGKGSYALLIDHVMRGDEAAYRCRAENVEGACSSVFFLSVRAKPKSARKDNQKSPNRRTVSFPPMFSTIVEKVEEEEKQGKELEMLPPSPLTDSYYALTLKSRATWPTFLGDWAFKNGNRRGSDDDGIPNGDVQGPQSPSEGRENARKTLRRSDLTARVHAKKQRLEEEKKQREEEAAKRKTDEKESEADRRKREEGEREKEEVRKKLEEKREDERKLETKLILEREERRRKRAELEKESAEKEEAMRKRREARAERIERERRVREEEEERWKKQQEEEENQRRLKAEKRQAEKELERAEAESLREKSLEKEQIEREEARRKEQEAKKKEEEKKKKEEEERKKYLEEKRKEEEKKKKEEEERKRLLEEKKKAEDKKRKEEEAKKKQLEEKKKEEEKKRKEEEEKKKQLEEKRKQDLKRKKQKEEEEQKRLAQLKRKEEESKRKKEKEEEEGNKSNRTENGIDQKLQSLFGTYKTVNGERHTSHTDKNNQKVDTEANNLASKPKAFQMFQQKTEEKPDQAAPKRPKPGVLGRFQEKFESHPASSMSKTTEEASGKPGKFTLPGSSAQDKMAALQNKSGLARGVGEGSNSSAGSQDKHIPEQTVLKKVSPWHKRDTTGVSNDTQDKQGKHVKLEAAKRKEQEKLEHEKKKEEKKLKEAKLKDQTKRKEEEKIKEETRKLEEKKRAEEKIKENKKKLGEQQKEKELKQKQEVEDKKRKEEEERRKKEEVIKSDLVRKQAAQREALEKRKKEEEAKLKAQLEKEEQEKMRLQFRKEQIRKEQLKRQRDEEIQKKQKKDKEEEEKRGRNKENMTATSPEDDDQVKVYKRDYSFSDLRKSLEATMTRGGAPVLDAEEHKYWDDILEKHNYSIGDIKKTLDTISSGSATLERPTRLRSRRNSIEDLEMVKMKRSSSISDLRESYTKSLERPKSKRKSSDTNKVKKDEEILKRTAKINETRQQLLDTVRKQLEPLTGGQSTREADITIRNLKTKTAETPTARSPVGGLPGNSIFLTQGTGSNPTSVPHMDNLSISVKSKRASIHEMISHKPATATPALRIASFSGKDVNKRKSYHGHDVHGSREIPVYRRAAGWDDNIGKSRDVSPQPLSCGSSGGSRGAVPSSTSSSSTSSSLTATTTDSKAGTTSRRPGKLTIPDKLGSEVRPFVFNSTRTIARRFKADS